MTALLDMHYMGGGFFPKGGSTSIARTLVAAVERRGGHVFASSPVEQILTMKNMFGQHSAYGVRVHGVDVLVKKFVISDAGVMKTFGLDSDDYSKHKALVDIEAGTLQRSLFHKQNDKKLDAVTPCISDLSLFIGLDRSDNDLGLLAQNIWHVHDWDHDEAWRKMMSDTSAGELTVD